MSDTPRTDARKFALEGAGPGGVVVHADFAGELERENAALRDSLQWVKSDIGNYGEVTSSTMDLIDAALAANPPTSDVLSLDGAFEFWCQRYAPEVWYGKEHDQAKEREYHRLRTCFKGGWDAPKTPTTNWDGWHEGRTPPREGWYAVWRSAWPTMVDSEYFRDGQWYPNGESDAEPNRDTGYLLIERWAPIPVLPSPARGPSE